MSTYKTLAEMGIKNPKEITKYKLRQDGHGDILTIYYKRKKGSFLPNSRKYEFSRSMHTVISDSGRQESEDLYEISPFLQSAIMELDSLVEKLQTNKDRKQEILEEVNSLERSIAGKLDELKSLLKELD